MGQSVMLEVQGAFLQREKRTLVSDLSFQLKAGRILAILGPNGAGKSSLLKGILGLLPLAGGSIAVASKSVSSLSASERAKVVAYVPQQSELQLGLTVEEVVQMGRFAHRMDRGYGAPRDREVVEDAILQCDLRGIATRLFSTLSGGEKGRVLIARALATEAKLLLLDEPTHSLDVPHAIDCLANLRRLATLGKTIVLVTHDLNQLSEFADEILLMKAGRKVAMGSPSQLLGHRVIESVFGVRLVPGAAFGYLRLPLESVALRA